MFDPETELDDRLAAEFGLKGRDIPFMPKVETEEQELKYNTKSFAAIRQAVHNAPNRRVDARAWSPNPYLLVTLNLDTPDRQLARNGFSMRIRFAYNPNNVNPIGSIDMCIKTTLEDGNIVKLFNQTRGEWEITLPTLKPDLQAMVEEHRFGKKPIPSFFQREDVLAAPMFVESVGCTMRNGFPSYEKFTRHGKTVVTAFSHTEDWKNIFLLPHADIVTSMDEEAEVEFDGFHNLTTDTITSENYESLMRKSMRLMDRTIITADMENIRHNSVTKSVRARMGLEMFYGPSKEETLKGNFDLAARIDHASSYALMQRICPEDVNFSMLRFHAGKMLSEMGDMMKPVEQTFHPAKYHKS